MNGVTLQAPVVAQRENAVLYRIDGGPLQLQDALVGRESDGWMIGSSDDPVSHAPRTRATTSPTTNPGLAVVRLTRIGWCPDPGAADDGQGDGPDRARSGSARTTSRGSSR